MSGLDDLGEARDSTDCASCGTSVDPLRAARVRLLGNRFFYFCSSRCADSYSPDESPSRNTKSRVSPLPRRDSSHGNTSSERVSDERRFESSERSAPRLENEDENENTLRESFGDDAGDHGRAKKTQTQVSPNQARYERRHDAETANATTRALTAGRDSQRVRVGEGSTQAQRNAATGTPVLSRERLLSTALTFGCLAIGLVLAQQSTLTTALRAGLLLLGNACLIVYWFRFERVSDRRHSATSTLLNVLSFLVGAVAWQTGHPEHDAAWSFCATLLATSSGTLLLLRRAYRKVDRQLAAQRAWLAQDASRVVGGEVESVAAAELRPGEEIVVHAGETVVADVTIVAGTAEVHPWYRAGAAYPAGPEDFIYAGASLASGQLRATVRWTGLDRHWDRLTNDPARRAEDHAPVVGLAKKLSVRGAPLITAAGVAVVMTASESWVQLALVTLACAGALLSPAISRLAGARVALAVQEGLQHGVVFRSAASLDATGRVSTAVFCARGTLLLGEPELSSIEADSLTSDEVLALAAGAAKSEQSPSAVALARAARARGVTPDAVRSPQAEHGLGVTAVASNGQPLVVGSRALLLRQRVSIARAESRITELEAMGRTVLLVALGGHLVGILALQDGLRGGARAAVQHLLDAGIEPVMLSGDARKSCEALGRTIDIDHIRPEVLPPERGREVQRLRSGGAYVAVIGRSPMDEVALTAASVSVALPSAGTQNMDYDVELATNEVQKAALALRLAHQCRRDALRSVMISFGGGVTAVLGVVAFSAPVSFIPLACMVATIAAAASLPTQRPTGSGTAQLDPAPESSHTS